MGGRGFKLSEVFLAVLAGIKFNACPVSALGGFTGFHGICFTAVYLVFLPFIAFFVLVSLVAS